MFGVICAGPAGEFKFAQDATEAERLEKAEDSLTAVIPLKESPLDWATYRANNARSPLRRDVGRVRG
jgi:hypothetical protein